MPTLISGIRALVARQWLDVVGVIVLGALLVVFREIDGNRQPFTPDTLLRDYGYPHKDDTVPSSMLATVVWMIPAASFIIAGCVKALSAAQASQHFLSFATAYFLTGVFTNAIKLTAGRPRPSTVTRCFPGTDLTTLSLDDTNFFTSVPSSAAYEPLCTNTDEDTLDSTFKSFCSGHTSYATCSGMFFTLFLVKQLRVFSGRSSAARGALALVPVFMGGWVGLTRIIDFEHHGTDVLAGFLLGGTIGAFFYFHAQATRDDESVDTPQGVQPAGAAEEGRDKAGGEALAATGE